MTQYQGSNAQDKTAAAPAATPAYDNLFTAAKKKSGRIDTAAAAPAASGSGKKKNAHVRDVGEPETQDSYFDEMEAYYNGIYADELEANRAALEAANARAEASAEEQRQSLESGYAAVNRQLYRDYMERRRTLPQTLAAGGFSGGLSESSLVRLANAYGDNLSANERARLSQLASVDAALSRQQFEAQQSAYGADREARRTYYAQIAALRQDRYSQQRSDEKTRAGVLATAGDYSGYRDFGFSDEDIEYLARMWRAKNPKVAKYQATGR
ncbi:MAG: hypothetical protein IKQ10_05395 [Oscillospiraceae bacterium]|nr:hypothetical protein [Oscillospiraceae bacterium]